MKTPTDTTTSFHPTLSFVEFLTYILKSFTPQRNEEYVQKLFPNTTPVLVDSGRSAFALVVEQLNLAGKTLVLPAYVCDAFLPVLIHYNITPIFLDVDKETYQPSLDTYTDEILGRSDAVLLVATYGKKPSQKIVSHLLNRGKIIIEDYAMRSPLLKEPLIGTARIYSLPKTLPVPDGGLAVLSNNRKVEKIQRSRFSITLLKNILKLIPTVSLIIARARDTIKNEQTPPKWFGIRTADALTKVILAEYSQKDLSQTEERMYSYCYPVLSTDLKDGVAKLRKNKMSVERIWQRPIILNPEASERYNIDTENFPTTLYLAKHVVCAPLWHIQNSESYDRYLKKLEEVLPDPLCK